MPDGKTYKAAPLIAEAKTPAGMSYIDTAEHMRKQTPRQRPMASGEWSRVLESLEKIKPELAESMITGAYEMTATFADYTHGKTSGNGKQFSGLLIELPEVKDDGLVAGSDGIIKARRVFEIPLPIRGDYVKKLVAEAPDLARFFNAIYGKEDAIKTLPDYAYFAIDDNPTQIRTLLRGHWYCGGRESRRVYVDGLWGPSDSDERVASRGAVDNARLVCKLNEAEYAASLERLIQSAKQAPVEEAADIIGQINEHLKGALVWEDI